MVVWEYDIYISYTMGTLVILLVLIIGIGANVTALHFFWKSVRVNVFSDIFSAVCLTDILTSILSIFVGLCYLLKRAPGPFGNPIIREIWGSLWNFTSRYSVFLVSLLSITRAVRIAFPFKQIQGKVVYAALVTYGVWLAVTTPALYGIPHYYKLEWCALALNKSEFVNAATGFRYYGVVLAIPATLLMPFPITLASCTVSVYKICSRIWPRGSTTTRLSRTTMDSSLYSGVTILIFAAIYLILNIPYGAVYVYVVIMSEKLGLPPPKVITNYQIKSYLFGMTHILSISLNAILNPVLYYCRMHDFKEHVTNTLSRSNLSEGPRDLRSSTRALTAARITSTSSQDYSGARSSSPKEPLRAKFYPEIVVNRAAEGVLKDKGSISQISLTMSTIKE